MSLELEDWLELLPRFHMARCKLCTNEEPLYLFRSDKDTAKTFATRIFSHLNYCRASADTQVAARHKQAKRVSAVGICAYLKEKFAIVEERLMPWWDIKSAQVALPGITHVHERRRSKICDAHRCVVSFAPSHKGKLLLTKHLWSKHGAIGTMHELDNFSYFCLAQRATNYAYIPLHNPAQIKRLTHKPWRLVNPQGSAMPSASSLVQTEMCLIIRPTPEEETPEERAGEVGSTLEVQCSDLGEQKSDEREVEALCQEKRDFLEALFKGNKKSQCYSLFKVTLEKQIPPRVIAQLSESSQNHPGLHQACDGLLRKASESLKGTAAWKETVSQMASALTAFARFSVALTYEARKQRAVGTAVTMVDYYFQGVKKEALDFAHAPSTQSLESYLYGLMSQTSGMVRGTLHFRVVHLWTILSLLQDGIELCKVRNRVFQALRMLKGFRIVIRVLSIMKGLKNNTAEEPLPLTIAELQTNCESFVKDEVSHCRLMAQIR